MTPATSPCARSVPVSTRGGATVNGELAAVTDWEPPPVKVSVARPSAVDADLVPCAKRLERTRRRPLRVLRALDPNLPLPGRISVKTATGSAATASGRREEPERDRESEQRRCEPSVTALAHRPLLRRSDGGVPP